MECQALLEHGKTFKLSSKEDAIKTYPIITVLRLLLSGWLRYSGWWSFIASLTRES